MLQSRQVLSTLAATFLSIYAMASYADPQTQVEDIASHGNGMESTSAAPAEKPIEKTHSPKKESSPKVKSKGKKKNLNGAGIAKVSHEAAVDESVTPSSEPQLPALETNTTVDAEPSESDD